jgi:NAD(P)H-dependent flavin oxidoreductase YrpB (nitropropane dioxygenase family)
VLDRLACPIVAAGGIGSRRQIAAVLAAGAGGVRMGTRFLAAAEADVHPRYLEQILAAGPEDTVLTEAFSAMWPNAIHRVLRRSVEAVEVLGPGSVGTLPTPAGPMGRPARERDLADPRDDRQRRCDGALRRRERRDDRSRRARRDHHPRARGGRGELLEVASDAPMSSFAADAADIWCPAAVSATRARCSAPACD